MSVTCHADGIPERVVIDLVIVNVFLVDSLYSSVRLINLKLNRPIMYVLKLKSWKGGAYPFTVLSTLMLSV